MTVYRWGLYPGAAGPDFIHTGGTISKKWGLCLYMVLGGMSIGGGMDIEFTGL